MARRPQSDQLDQALTALLARREAPSSDLGPSLAPLLAIATELRHLPRERFKERLKAGLLAAPTRQGGKMSTASTPVREGFQTVMPYLLVRKPTGLIEFLKQAFGATEVMRGTGSAGGLHAEVRIGDSRVMMGGFEQEPPPDFEEMPTALHLYVEDADAVYRSALEAGATSLGEPADRDYGERSGFVKDPFGNHWYIATHKGPSAVPEGLRTVTPYLHARGAAGLIDFLERGLGAQEAARHQSPEGIVHHAKLRIGDSIVEMGEAQGPAQPMPTTFYVDVLDVDLGYERALQAGAGSVQLPADQFWGARTAAVKDPSGNVWYLVAPIEKAPR